MEILLRQVIVVNPSSPFHQQQVDILIQNGFITELGAISSSAGKEISIKGLHVSIGWCDLFSNFCDPGLEYKETIGSGAESAAYGGYTHVAIIPNTTPAIHNKSGIEYIIHKARQLPIDIHPIGAITKNTEGKELAEMYDMQSSGAVAFSDGTAPVQSSGILLKALQYVKAIGKTIIQVPDDKGLSGHGLMNEGITATRLGLAGKPALSEELMIARDIELVKYTGSEIHFTGISTAKSVELISNAKKSGIAVTCSVTPYHLFFTDRDLNCYDTNLKVNPPLRLKEDQQALKQALLEGIIDCIASHHLPQHTDNKVVEFEYANDGMIGLETTFAAVRTAVPELPIEKLIALITEKPRKILDIPVPKIEKGVPACLTLFLPDQIHSINHFRSKSKNSPFTSKELIGKPIGIINKDQLILSE